MRTFTNFLFLFLASGAVFCHTMPPENKDLNTEAKILSATLFFSGVQLQNECSVNVTGAGKTLIKIKNISSYADEKSIQVSGEGKFTILSVNYKSAPQKVEETEVYKKMEKESKAIEDKIIEEHTWLAILQKREQFYGANISVTGKTQVISADQLKALADMYTKNIETIRFEMTGRRKKIEDLEKDLKKTNERLNNFKNEQQSSGGEIWVLINTIAPVIAKFNISYFTYNAGWYPSYDIRVNKLNEPMIFTYKANIYQHSGLDWKNVSIKCSNATPFQQGDLPELQPYYLYYGNYSQPSYNAVTMKQVTGMLRDEQTGEALQGGTVLVQGTNYGTVTDLEGKFKLNVPSDAMYLEFKYVGYVSTTRTISDYMDITLQPNTSDVDGITAVLGGVPSQYGDVTGGIIDTKSGIRKSGEFAQLIAGQSGVTATQDQKVRKIRPSMNIAANSAGYIDDSESYIPEVNMQMAATSIDFEIKEPYTVKSDGAVMTVDIKEAEITALFEYHTTPKLEASAFLIARIPDWEKYSLLAGDANLYIENTFVGKSLLDVNQMKDTLSISLGRDKNVIVKREKVKETLQRQILGSNRIVTRSWKISVRNNKNTSIQLFIHDQLPVSENKDISVEKIDISGAKESTEKGSLEWKLDLPPAGNKEVSLKYSVKYPKSSGIVIY